MMMTKKRKIKSTLSGEPKQQFVRAVLAATLGIVVAGGLGAVARTQAATINVPADYATIQEAVDASAPGDTIEVAEGEYAGAEIFTTVKIHGSGPGTRITTGLPPYGDGFDIVYGDAAGTEISNLTIAIEASTPKAYVVYIYKAGNCIVRNVTITGTYSLGILAQGSESSNVTITGNTISGTYEYGLYPYYSHNATITGNTISGTYKHGLHLSSSPDATITGNTIEGSYGEYGMRVNKSHNPTITGNTITGTYKRGIMVGNSLNTTITGNTIEGSYGEYGMRVNKSHNPTITGNTISGTSKYTIYIRDSLDATVKGNDISGHNKENNIRIRESNNSVVTDNTITGKGRFAIRFQNSHSGQIIRNTIWDFDSSGKVVNGVPRTGAPIRLNEGSSGNSITNNTFDNVCLALPFITAGIRVESGCNNNSIQANDYSNSGLPGWGWPLGDPIKPGCVLLEKGTSGNQVNEPLSPSGKRFPPGTMLCDQVKDLTDDSTTLEYDGANKISGYPACVNNPNWLDILEHLQNVPPEPEEDEE